MKIELSWNEIALIVDSIQGTKNTKKTEEEIQIEKDHLLVSIIAQLP